MSHNSSKGAGQKPLDKMMENAFFATHPYPIMMFETDDYYNKVAKKVVPMLNPIRTQLNMPNQIIMRMALAVTAYLEDQCSHLGLWATFIHRYRELYGKWLPWYDTTSDDADYFDDEVNLQDVKFILWMILVSTEGTPVVSPEHEAIGKSAERIFSLLKEEFELAPVNKQLVDYVYSEVITRSFYSLKNIFRWMTTTCYLMGVPTWQMEQCAAIRKSITDLVGPTSDPGMVPYFESSYECVRMPFGPLALYPKDWFVLMRRYRGITLDNKDIEEIQSTPFYPFMVVSNNGDTLTLRSCRNVDYEVDTDSFGDEYGKEMKPGDMMITQLVHYKGHWVSNGVTQLLQTKDTVEKAQEVLNGMAKKLMHNNQAIDLFNLPDYSVKIKVDPVMADNLKDAVDKNNGDRIFYFKGFKEALEWQNRMAGREIFNYNMYKETFNEDPLMVYVLEDYQTISMSMAQTIHDPSNPYYQEDLAFNGIELLYNKYGVVDEFVAYVVKHNYLDHLTFNPRRKDHQDAKLIQDNLPFFATFMRMYPC